MPSRASLRTFDCLAGNSKNTLLDKINCLMRVRCFYSSGRQTALKEILLGMAKFKSLGSKTTGFPTKPDRKILETFNNRHPGSLYLVPLVCNEFTSICPITGQPDFARFEIVYAPKIKMVESKSLKLYLFSFRNHGEFHEDVTNRIFKDLWQILSPKFMRVIGDFNVRGGISIKPLVQKLAKNLASNQKQEILQMLESWDRAKPHLQN